MAELRYSARRAAVGIRPLVQLTAGLVLLGVGVALMARARLGLGPWDVLHQGIARRSGLPLGTVTIIVGALVLATWRLVGQRPRIGTLANVVLVGLVIDLVMAYLAPATQPAVRALFLVAALVLLAGGSGMYLAACLGAGPRDGLMTALAKRRAWPIWQTRVGLEILALLGGVALGGRAGIATVLVALGIGPLVQVALRWFRFDLCRSPLLGEEPAQAIGVTGK